MSELKTVILAAGEGTRLKSEKPKVLHTVLGMPMISHVINATRDAGIDDICVVVGHKSDIVKTTLLDTGVSFAYQDKQLGTGHAVMMANDFMGDSGTVLVLYGDTPMIKAETLKQFLDTHKNNNNAATFITTLVEEPFGYGRVIRKDGVFVKVVEHKDATEEEKMVSEINVGMYCFDVQKLKEALKQIKNDNSNGEYYLPDVVPVLMSQGEVVSPYLAEDNEELEGVNTKVQLALATSIMQNRINEYHMLNGVEIISPSNTFIEPGIEIGSDTVILPGTILEKRTKVGKNCIIGPNSRIINSSLGSNCKVESSVVIQSQMGNGSDVGPFAYLRPGSKLGEKVHVGDFVELKNVSVGGGTKIPHLTYVGDAEVGESCNLGCGTVTANYDGVNKFKTRIGNNAFIGCNTVLVAPVEIADEAYTASGSVVTQNVPDGALAIARSKQVVKEGWRKNSGKYK